VLTLAANDICHCLCLFVGAGRSTQLPSGWLIMGGKKCCWNDCQMPVNQPDGGCVAIPKGSKRSKYCDKDGNRASLPQISAWREQWLKACGLDVAKYKDTDKLRLCRKHIPQHVFSGVDRSGALLYAPSDQNVCYAKLQQPDETPQRSRQEKTVDSILEELKTLSLREDVELTPAKLALVIDHIQKLEASQKEYQKLQQESAPTKKQITKLLAKVLPKSLSLSLSLSRSLSLSLSLWPTTHTRTHTHTHNTHIHR
jgi:hypothetical protein